MGEWVYVSSLRGGIKFYRLYISTSEFQAPLNHFILLRSGRLFINFHMSLESETSQRNFTLTNLGKAANFNPESTPTLNLNLCWIFLSISEVITCRIPCFPGLVICQHGFNLPLCWGGPQILPLHHPKFRPFYIFLSILRGVAHWIPWVLWVQNRSGKVHLTILGGIEFYPLNFDPEFRPHLNLSIRLRSGHLSIYLCLRSGITQLSFTLLVRGAWNLPLIF